MDDRYRDSLRHEGTRWRLLYGCYEGVETFAVNELQRIVQDYLPYVIEAMPASPETPKDAAHVILIGTGDSNPLIARLMDDKRIDIPNHSEGFTICLCPSPWCDRTRLLVIAGSDPAGVSHGVQDFAAKIPAGAIGSDLPAERRVAFDNMPDFTTSDYPLIENRGIWTWGYVIYDYRRFIDNMARLRMNMLTIWNDCPPVNIEDIIAYAHSRGLRVVLGFHWGWGLDHLTLADPDHRRQIREMVLQTYDRQYAGLGMDGIYFQTLTEGHDKSTSNETLASCACKLVNEISAALFEAEPDLYVQFGLHAMSIQQDYPDLKALDPRVTIVWEDAGVLPFSYNFTINHATAGWSTPKEIDTFEKTLEYAKHLATFRNNTEFAMVAKGWTTLQWEDEFEHHGPFIMGERSREFTARRLSQRQDRWDFVNKLAMENYPLAMEFYRAILDCNPPTMTVTGLIEDGMFEETIQPSVALFAQTIWNPRTDAKTIRQACISPHYRGAR